MRGFSLSPLAACLGTTALLPCLGTASWWLHMRPSSCLGCHGTAPLAAADRHAVGVLPDRCMGEGGGPGALACPEASAAHE